jgi:hypothetical protein
MVGAIGVASSLNETPTGISIDNTSGAVTVGYQGVQNGSEVTANESLLLDRRFVQHSALSFYLHHLAVLLLHLHLLHLMVQ